MASITGSFYPLKKEKNSTNYDTLQRPDHREGHGRAGYHKIADQTPSCRKAMAQKYFMPGSEADREVMACSIMPRQHE